MAKVDFKQANENYAANFGDNSKLNILPSKHLIVGKQHNTAHDLSQFPDSNMYGCSTSVSLRLITRSFLQATLKYPGQMNSSA